MTFTIKTFQNKYQIQVLNLIANIQEGEFNVPIDLKQYQELKNIPAVFQKGKGNYWIALDEERVIGTMALLDIGENMFALRDVFVHPDYRGQEKGVSKKLLDTIFTWTKGQRIEKIYLSTTLAFLAAHRFYEKNGFVEIRQEELPKNFPIMEVDKKFYKHDLY